MNECQLVYKEEENMVIFAITAVCIASQSSLPAFLSTTTNCQTSKISTYKLIRLDYIRIIKV
jgi:hypothetical protein